MDFVQPRESNRPLVPQGWQRSTCDTTGDTFYVHLASGRIVYKFCDMRHQEDSQKKRAAVTPLRAKSATIEPLPENSVSGVVNMFSTPRRSFKDGTSLKPVQLDDDEVSEVSDALSDLTNTQLVKKRPPKKLKRVFHAADESQGTVIGEEGYESAEYSREMSPNYLDDE
jgi:hypothetical protein